MALVELCECHRVEASDRLHELVGAYDAWEHVKPKRTKTDAL